MPKTKLIMFDYDGTIADTFTLTCHIYNEIFRQFKIEKSLTKRQYQDLFETDWKECIKKLGITNKDDVHRCSEIYFNISQDFLSEIRLYPKVRTMLHELSKQYKLAIVSNGKKEHIIDRITFLDIAKYFAYVGGFESGEKPSAEPLLKCVRYFGFAPEEAIYVGDMDGDIASAKNAKLKKAIAVSYGYHHNDRLKAADIIVNHPLEIIKNVE
ncbi:HAD-IA family hydrolase [Candidatus Woesearchaeota archaeon]|nr:HAD-IA family hydrolase [Candidatus Woesearchaeota archaeon]